MTSALSWEEEAYFPSPATTSVDSGTTNLGPLWHVVTQRWGHSMHTMCPYQGMFPPKIAHYFIQKYSKPDATVLDPFSGRGTTVLQARAEGRAAIGNDLSPLAFVLTKAKSNPPAWTTLMRHVDRLERAYKKSASTDPTVSEDIKMLFHKDTLRQLWFLREGLLAQPLSRWSPETLMVAGAMAGILHGSTRSDGSSAYLSISMPNTFSMAPAYVRKYIRDNRLRPPEQDVFARLREKLARLYVDDVTGPLCSAAQRDAISLLGDRGLKGSIDLIVTSPPYLQVVNYGTANWIRLWWLGLDEVSRQSGAGRKLLDDSLDHRHRYDAYQHFIAKAIQGVRHVLTPNGVAAIVIGDVASPGGTSVALAERIWHEIGPDSGLKLVSLIEDVLPSQQKVSRIWGETKGRATDRECVLVLSRMGSRPQINEDVGWEEPYKDAGPDAAHALLRSQRSTLSGQI
jgi:hypothetical protein